MIYTYDETNKLIKGINKENQEVGYVYDGLGALLKRTGATTEDIVVDYTTPNFEPLISVKDGVTTRYTYGNERLGVNIAGKGYTYHIDNIGKRTQLADNEIGKLRSYSDFDPWGVRTQGKDLDVNGQNITLSYYYGTHDIDTTLGMYYAKARFYDQENKRFTALDKVKGSVYVGDSTNGYLYCLNEPIMRVDPDGREGSNLNPTKKVISYIGSDSLGKNVKRINGKQFYNARQIFGVAGGKAIWDSSTSTATFSVLTGSGRGVKVLNMKVDQGSGSNGSYMANMYFNNEYLGSAETYLINGTSYISEESIMKYFKRVWCKGENVYNKIEPAKNETFGKRTLAVGVEGSASFIARIAGGNQIVFDEEGNVGILMYGAVGGGTPSLAISGIFTVMDAETIFDLNGLGFSAGGSSTIPFIFAGGWSGGIEYNSTFAVTKKQKEEKEDRIKNGKKGDYSGNTYSAGPSINPILFEAHGEMTYTYVIDITPVIEWFGIKEKVIAEIGAYFNELSYEEKQRLKDDYEIEITKDGIKFN